MRKKMYLAGGLGAAVVIGGLAAPRMGAPEDPPATAQAPAQGGAMVDVAMPDELSETARIGRRVFAAKCAACHGAHGGGVRGKGPPLIHEIYESSHHGDRAFLLAARNGVRAHHWTFGSMPPVEGVTDADVKAATAYIREIQQENGIF
jgi:mono/diheme cytochrome c family protein